MIHGANSRADAKSWMRFLLTADAFDSYKHLETLADYPPAVAKFFASGQPGADRALAAGYFERREDRPVLTTGLSSLGSLEVDGRRDFQ